MRDPSRFDWHDSMDGFGLLAGPANVIMQLSLPGVGYGVLESPVDSGKATLHPFKRARTTGTYLAVATVGTPEQQRAFRDAVNKVHAQVRSGAASPVRYNAFDQGLQLWVTACLYRGVVDVQALLRPYLDDTAKDLMYREASRLGTTLQVRDELWPADRAAFARYWDQTVAGLRIDEPVRRYLDDLIHLRHRPRVTQWLLAPIVVFFTTGFLPPEFRALMGMRWSDRQQRRFERATRFGAALTMLLPGPIRHMPLNLYLLDLRLRMRFRRPLV
jgi:uncharacterized protein (DUF2236 family)